MPVETSITILVIFAGCLGGIYRYVYDKYVEMNLRTKPDVSSARRRHRRYVLATFSIQEAVLQAMIGSMCALITYVLSRVAVVAILEKGKAEDILAMSPFVIAFLAVISGIFSDEAFAKIASAAKSRGIGRAPADSDA